MCNGAVATPPADVALDVALVEKLLAEQCPALAGLPVTPFTHGWDNEIFRLGESLVVRLPRRARAAPLIENEITWLPAIDSLVTVPVPQPVFAGHASDLYPYAWLVAPWYSGTAALHLPLSERTSFAEQLADFVWTLHSPAPRHAPVNPVRGMSLAQEAPDARARARIAVHPERDALLQRWESWTNAPEFDGVDVWLHGDLHPANLIVNASGGLEAVIDWGDLTAGDPACDLSTAWLMFDDEGREIFVDRLSQGGATDESTWCRARAWALHLGLMLASDCDPCTPLQAVGLHALDALLSEPI